MTTDAAEEPRYYHVQEDPTEYSLWLDFRKHGNLFGVPAEEVPALVRAGKDVWTFGYGWDQGDIDPGEYTTIGEDDLWAFEDPLDKGVVDSWGPFATEERPHMFASSIYPGAVCSGPMGCGKTWEEHQPLDDPADRFTPETTDETVVTIRVLLPLRSTTTSFSIDTESEERRDALVAFLLAHGITDFTTAVPALCLSCRKTEAEHQAWCEDLGDTFIAPITSEVNP